MKFTEEQYQKIVEISSQYIKDSAWGLIGTPDEHPIALVLKKSNLMDEIDFFDSAEELMAIANPLTREWAHDNFVEKEKKYVWSSNNSLNGYRTRLFIGENGIVTSYAYFDTSAATFNEQLTESEIKAWGYNPEMFDREEV